jgi:hypothetical protein
VYTTVREEELKKEEKQKISDRKGELFALVEKYSKGKSPSSYRFKSRAACNYAFPGLLPSGKTIDRPYPSDKEFKKAIKAEISLPPTTETAPVVEPLGDITADELTEEERKNLQKFRGNPDLTTIPTRFSQIKGEEEREMIRGLRDTREDRTVQKAVTEALEADEGIRTGIEEEEEGEQKGGDLIEEEEEEEEVQTGIEDEENQEGGMPKENENENEDKDPLAGKIPYPIRIRNAMLELKQNPQLFALKDEVNGLKKYSWIQY